jgi:DNA polymerase-3 subunit epsilon
MPNRSLDTMDLTLHLDDAGAFAGRPMAAGFSLDGLCEMFGVKPHDRHTAGGDALLTAHVFLRLLRAAKRVGRDSLAQLCEPYKAAT